MSHMINDNSWEQICQDSWSKSNQQPNIDNAAWAQRLASCSLGFSPLSHSFGRYLSHICCNKPDQNPPWSGPGPPGLCHSPHVRPHPGGRIQGQASLLLGGYLSRFSLFISHVWMQSKHSYQFHLLQHLGSLQLQLSHLLPRSSSWKIFWRNLACDVLASLLSRGKAALLRRWTWLTASWMRRKARRWHWEGDACLLHNWRLGRWVALFPAAPWAPHWKADYWGPQLKAAPRVPLREQQRHQSEGQSWPLWGAIQHCWHLLEI